MAASIGNNSSLAYPADYFIRIEINRYVAKINFSLAFVQSFISLTGVLGNILALIIINRKSLRYTSSAVFITYMAIFDSTVLLLHATNLARPRGNLFLHCSITYLTDLFTFCANWVLVIITLERCVAVSSPLLAKRFCTIYSARRSVYILLIVAMVMFSSTFPIIYHTNESSNRRKCLIRPRLALIHRIYQPIVLYGIPDILLLSNLYTIFTLFRRRKKQKRRASDVSNCEMRVSDVHSNRKQRQLTLMLVTVNLSFYLFTTPAMILYIAEYHPPKHIDITKLKRSFLLSQISVILLQLNNATNFLFYCFAGQRFRQATVETFHRYSAQMKFFYHRYILCKKDYRLSMNDQRSSIECTRRNNRRSNSDVLNGKKIRTSTL